ncbi:[4Fe-4S] cluster assembly scaffold protein Mrp (=ApbC) [hydrothermal vent metagenome]|uniref:[4Fe-4S] cluster assembly scaffold protein Mrp (=ApbC) n=1 Tax=hydrothermal vent metagenome TaxID=652676 RepID=A0A3B1D7Z8_9ZZZZ
MSTENVKSIIAISSCKGGVGKSTVSALLALDLVKKGYKVGLVDADIYGPSLPSLFHLHNTTVYTNEKKEILPIEKNGLKLMSFGFLLGDAPAVLRGPLTTRYIQQILGQTAWGELDYLLIDMPPGTGDIQLTITQMVQLSAAVIVTTPHTLSLVDVARGILMFEKVNVPILGIIENMSFFQCDQCDKKHYPFGKMTGKLKDRFGLDSLAQWPLLPPLVNNLENPSDENLINETTTQLLKALETLTERKGHTPNVQFDTKKITLTWSDGSTICVSNRDLRLSCKCALCIDELTGAKLLKEDTIKDDIAAKSVTPLGNYAVSIQWNDGHSSGIYPYSQLQR